MKRKKTTDLAYCAGVLDSDGYIGIIRSQYAPGKWTYWERVQVDQAELEALYVFLHLFGGKIRKYPSRTRSRRPMAQWGYSGRPARACLVALLPWLRIKQQQARAVLRLRPLVERGKRTTWTRGRPGGGRGHAPRPLWLSDKLETLHWRVQALKHYRFKIPKQTNKHP